MFSINGRFLTQVELLPFNKIHGIRPAPNHSSSGKFKSTVNGVHYSVGIMISACAHADTLSVSESAVGDDVSSGRNVLVFGQKSLRFVTLQPSLLR